MKKITKISGKCIPLNRDDVDTDLIIPAQYLTAVTKEGYGANLFRRLRESDPQFVFNQQKFSSASILITKANFGCGSSREHAVWALQEAGIEAIIAISFADIFASNSAKNGLLLITLPEETIDLLVKEAQSGDYQLIIDVESQRVITLKNQQYEFIMDPFHKHCFVEGLDNLDYLLSFEKEITTYEKEHSNFAR